MKKIAMVVILSGLVVSALAGAIFVRLYLREIPPIESLQTYIPSLVTRIFDVKRRVISEVYVERRSLIPLERIPLHMRQAMVAIEDARFYEHWGMDFKGIFRAFLANFRAGRVVQGGSTITQQLAKTIFLSRERTFKRKFKELFLTLQMEHNFSKDEILQMYLNQIYFGSGAYGVEAAAQVFFSKIAEELSLAECALLAALPKAPRRYSPYRNPERAHDRRNIVLKRMFELGYITTEEREQAEIFPFNTLQQEKPPSVAAYFVEYIKILLEPIYGEDALLRGGLSIYTTLDLDIQRAAKGTADHHLALFDKMYGSERAIDEAQGGELVPVQGALVALDPRSGAIRAMVGGRDFKRSQFNRSWQAKRQPGSSFKPFVWMAALESGLTTASIVEDYPLAYKDVEFNPRLIASATAWSVIDELVEPFREEARLKWEEKMKDVVLEEGEEEEEFKDGIWMPDNYDHKFLGPVTLRTGLARSRNLVSVRLIDRTGPRSVVDIAHRAGIVSRLDSVLALSLGVSVVTPLEMANAFATILSGGIRAQPYVIERVEDAEGKVLEENVPSLQAALSTDLAYLVTHMLQAVVSEGTGRRASRLGRPVAGKTGTTQDQRDLWFVGGVPQLVAACWIGYDDFVSLGEKLSSSRIVVPWWTDFMEEALKNVPAQDFNVPPGIVFSRIDAESGLLALPTCKKVVLSVFRRGNAPTTFCNLDHFGEPESEESEENHDGEDDHNRTSQEGLETMTTHQQDLE